MEVYFVGSDCDSPDQLYFTLDDAKKDFHPYIDSFDERGIKVATYTFEGDGYIRSDA